MKTLWNIVSFLAVVHLLALAMFLAWLWKSERLDGRRIHQLREMLAMTISEADAVAAGEAQDAALLQQQRATAVLRQNPGLPSAERVRNINSARQTQQRSSRRIDDVKAQLSRQLAQDGAQIMEQRLALETDRLAIDGGIADEQQLMRGTQFTKAVKLLESLQPKQAKQQIIELVMTGKKDQAVAYLDAMNQRAAGKILGEFKTVPENALATELLELIRTLGRPDGQAGAGMDSSNADGSANTP